MVYVGQSSCGQYFSNQSSSSLISALVQQYIYFKLNDAQYQRQLFEPYRQYLQDPYLIDNYH